jgi:hypothetical protein
MPLVANLRTVRHTFKYWIKGRDFPTWPMEYFLFFTDVILLQADGPVGPDQPARGGGSAGGPGRRGGPARRLRPDDRPGRPAETDVRRVAGDCRVGGCSLLHCKEAIFIDYRYENNLVIL